MGIGKTVSKRIGLRSPSKYLSLEYLQDIRESYYCNLDAGIDYVPCEVDALIYMKQSKKDAQTFRKTEKEYEIYEIEMLKQKGVKWCSNCKEEKPFSQFHKDESKKNFKLRSHCKACRKPKLEMEHDHREHDYAA